MDIDMGAVAEVRQELDITYTCAVVKATGMALPEHRLLNASLQGDQILLHKKIDVGVAVDSPRGMVMVTIPGADARPLTEIDGELRELSEQARQGGGRTAQRSTFTVTNSGVLGTLMFTPIINPPQSAVLGMGKVQEMPVVRDGQIVVRPLMYLCLTYDHRIIEGAEAVRFLTAVKEYLEDPKRMR
jgi:2-oxoglutarate dehydrogenase E2 component (dihydrolipoamide succinyltransferase)